MLASQLSLFVKADPGTCHTCVPLSAVHRPEPSSSLCLRFPHAWHKQAPCQDATSLPPGGQGWRQLGWEPPHPRPRALPTPTLPDDFSRTPHWGT